jgi:hypothetical protein
MHTETTRTKSTAIRTAMPAFAPVLRPPLGEGCGGEVEDGEDIMVVGVMESAVEVRTCLSSACAVGAADDDAACWMNGVRTRVVVMSVLAISESARHNANRKTTVRERLEGREKTSVGMGIGRSVRNRSQHDTIWILDAGGGPRGLGGKYFFDSLPLSFPFPFQGLQPSS